MARKCLRPPELRAQPRSEPRSRRPDQHQEGECVSACPVPSACSSSAYCLRACSPREAAFEIVHLVNSRNQNVALLALAVGLDTAYGVCCIAAADSGSSSTSASRTAGTPSNCRSAQRSFSMSWCGGSPSGRRCGRRGCSTASWRRSRSGGRPSARRRGTRRIWALSGTCTGYCSTRATCSQRSAMKTPPS